MIVNDRLTKILHQLYREDGSLPDYALNVILTFLQTLRGLGNDIREVQVGIKGDNLDLMTGLAADLDRLNRKWDDAYPLLPKRWKEFESLVQLKIDDGVKSWRPIVARAVGITPDLLRHYEERDNVPREYFIRLLKTDLHVSSGPSRLDRHAKKIAKLLLARGQPVSDVAVGLSILLGIEVTQRQIQQIDGDPKEQDERVAIQPANSPEPITAGEIREMARVLYGDGRTAGQQFVATVGHYTNIPTKLLMDLVIGRDVTVPEAVIRRFYHEELSCRKNPQYLNLTARFGDIEKPPKGGEIMDATEEIETIAQRWFGEADYLLCLAHFTGVSKANLDRMFRGRRERKPSVALVQFIRDIDAALMAIRTSDVEVT